MNELCEKFPGQLAVLAFPTNQFGHQENSSGEEILNVLKHVRPGNEFQFKGDLFDKVEVNGANEHPLFSLLKKELPTPHDDTESLMSNPQFFIWKPVKRTDISWNFEKFLIGPDGKLVERFGRYFPTADLKPHIQKALDNC